MCELTQEQLKFALSYDAQSGVFTWDNSLSQNINRGDVANCTNNRTKYKVLGLNNKRYLQHRLAWLYVYGEFPCGQIDHINGIRDDNRISNLRVVTAQENLKNQRMRVTNTSGFTGVNWDKRAGKWKSQIDFNKKRIYIGTFSTIIDAVAARMKANIKYGFHKNHGIKPSKFESPELLEQ